MNKYLKITLKIVLSIVVLLALILLVLKRPPEILTNYLKSQIETQVLKNTGLYTEVNQLDNFSLGLTSQRFNLSKITIHKNKFKNSKYFLKVNDISLKTKFNIITYLINKNDPKGLIEIKIDRPKIDLRKEKNGKLDLKLDIPKKEKKEQTTSSKYKIPNLKLLINDSKLNYIDKNKTDLNIDLNIPLLDVTYFESSELKYNLLANENLDSIKISGENTFPSGKGSLNTDISINDINKWTKLVKNKFAKVNQGEVSFKLNSSWNDLKLNDLKFNSELSLKKLTFSINELNKIYKLNNLNIKANEKLVNIERFLIKSNNEIIILEANTKYNGQDNYLKANLETKNIIIEDYLKLVKSKKTQETIKKIGPKGIFNSSININGNYPKTVKKFIEYPKSFSLKDLKGLFELNKANIYKTKVNGLSLEMIADKNSIEVKKLSSKISDGQIYGKLKVKDIYKDGNLNKLFLKEANILGNITTKNINIAKQIKNYVKKIPVNYAINKANLISYTNLSGTISDPIINSQIIIPTIIFDKRYSKLKPINNFVTNIQYKNRYSTINSNFKSNQFGKTNLAIKLINNDNLSFKIKNNDFKIDTLNNFVKKLNVKSGTANLNSDLKISLNQIKKYKKVNSNVINRLLKINGNLGLNNLDLDYQLPKEKVFKLNKANLNGEFKLNRGLLSASSKLNSKQYKEVDLKLLLSNLNKLKTDIVIDKFSAKNLEDYIPNLTVKSGEGSVKLAFDTSVNRFSRKKYSFDQLTYLINTNSFLQIKDFSYEFKPSKNRKISVNDAVYTTLIDIDDGVVNSNIFMNSKEFGELQGHFNINKKRQVNGKITNEEINLENINSFVPKVNILKGKASLEAIIKGNIRKFAFDNKSIKAFGFLKLNDVDLITKEDNYEINILNLSDTFNYENGIFNNLINLKTKKLGESKAEVIVKQNGLISGKIKANLYKLEYLNPFISSESLIVNNGNSLLDIDLETSLKEIKKSPLNFKAKGDFAINNFNLDYLVNKQTTFEELKEVSEKKYNQNIEKFNITFDWKNGFLNVYDTFLKEKESSIIGKASLNIKSFLNKKRNNLGNLNVKIKNLKFIDFPILKKVGINDGNIELLKFNANIPNSVKNLDFDLETKIQNLIYNRSNLNNINILIDTHETEDYVEIKELDLIKDNAYFKTKGKIEYKDLKNPKLDISVDSYNFPIKTILAMVPYKYLTKNEHYGEIKKSGKTIEEINNITYNLPEVYKDGNNFDNLINYWEKWSLDPLDEETKREETKVKNYWENISGDLTLKMNAKGKLKNPDLDIVMGVTNGKVYNLNINEILVNADYKNKNLSLKRFHLIEQRGGYLKLSGEIKNELLDFEGEGDIDIDWANNFIASNLKLQGKTDIVLDVKGSSKNPNVSFQMETKQGIIKDIYFDNFLLLAELKDNKINLSEVTLLSNGRETSASGIIPLDKYQKDLNLTLNLKDDSIGLINVVTKDYGIDWLSGDGDVYMNIQGSIDDPIINGEIDIERGQMFMSSINNSLNDINMDIKISNHFVKINQANAYLNGGKVDLFGQVDLIGFKPGFLKLKVVSKDFRWKEDNLELNGQISLRLNNTISEPLIGGVINLEKGEVYFDIGRKKKSSSSGSQKKKKKSSLDIRYNNLRVQIPEESEFWVRSPLFDLRAKGNMNLKKGSLKDPAILGAMKIDKGGIYALNNEFSIKSATADFEGKEFDLDAFPINPKLNIIAETKLSNPSTEEKVLVEAQITGYLEDIANNTLDFKWIQKGSLTESEIWQQVIGLRGAQLVAQDAGNIAKIATPYFNRAVFNPLTSKIADFLNFDELNIGIASDSISKPGVLISLQVPIYKGLSLGYNGVVRDRVEFDLFSRYRLNKNLSLKGTISGDNLNIDYQALELQANMDLDEFINLFKRSF